MTVSSLRRAIGLLGVALLISYAAGVGLTGSPTLEAPAYAQTQGNVPGQALGNTSDAEFWRGIRKGVTGTVSIADKKAGVLVQSEGDSWRAIRNGPIITYGAWIMLAAVVALALFFVVRGRIKIDSGLTGRLVQRFTEVEVFVHWFTAFSFIIQAITGLTMMYGKFYLMPILGQEAFATLLQYGKYAHNFISFSFMLGVLAMIVLWARDNIWDDYDPGWILSAGGLFSKGSHPPAGKFNFGQKSMFWMAVIGGGTMAYTGLNLMFPFLFGDLQDMQLYQGIHAVLGIIMATAILGHIYIGTLGMVGAFSAMGTGYVDENWLRENHSAWYEEQMNKTPAAPGGEQQPAE